MKEDPNPEKSEEDSTYKGDDILKKTGDVGAFRALEMFSYNYNEKDSEFLFNGTPSQVELLHKDYKNKKQKIINEQKEKLYEKYGKEENKLDFISKEILVGQSETYFEYNMDGKIVNGKKKIFKKSKYLENILINDHVSVYGSYFEKKSMKWGFACCKQLDPTSYCTLDN
jgi:pre-mRNA-processing factor SLU7